MPYISKTERALVEKNPFYGKGNPGVLNYRITKQIIEWLPREPRYADYDAAIGALECAKMELYRRLVADHEDSAIERNGDVYPKHLLPSDEVTDDDPPGLQTASS